MSDAHVLDRAGSLARKRPLELAIGLLAIAAVSVWVYSGVRTALIGLMADNLRTLINSQVIAFEAWVSEKRLNVQRWASDPRLLAAVEPLVAASARGAEVAERACRGEAGSRLIAILDTLRQPDVAASVHLIGVDGRILAARDPAKCGRVVADDQRAGFARVVAGETVFAGSRTDVEHIGAVPGVKPSPPRIWLTAPVRDATGQVIALLDIGKPAEERFSQLFEAARAGATGEAYAFDTEGRMVTASRFPAALHDVGRLKIGESPIGRLRLTDPTSEAAEPPLTQLVQRALAVRESEKEGTRLEPYRNYVGDNVVGAWRWLDAYDIGIALEVGESEAFAPLARLETAFLVLGSLVGAAVFGLVVALLRMLRMQQEVEALQRIGNYELLEEIGHGGFARVYRARHRLLKRPTAVKVIELRVSTDEMLARFDREAKLLSQLTHPNTVEIFDFGRTPEGQPFFAMEFLDGLTLQQVVERWGSMPPARVAHVLRGMAGSLAEVHARGLVHRDIKPANVMLCKAGGEFDVVKVLDFGLVKDTTTEATRDLTRALKILGTPAYMAPERIEQPDGADFRSDLYALGAVGSFLLRGAPPFEGENDLALAFQVVNSPPPPLDPSVPEGLARLILHCMQKRPEARPQSATDVINALDPLLALAPWTYHDARAWWQARDRAATQPTGQPRALPMATS